MDRIPTLSQEEIEDRAKVLLELYRKDFFEYVQHTRMPQLVEFLATKFRVKFDFDSSMGFTENGERILGATNLKKHIVLVDVSLKDDEHRFNFTLAHELGHLSLHRKIRVAGDNALQVPATRSIQEKPTRQTNSFSDLAKLEWQANIFATALLMPAKTVRGAVGVQQQLMGKLRRETIYIDNQNCTQVDYQILLGRLSDFFRVSSEAVEHRVIELGLIRGGHDVRSIGDLLRDY